MFYRAIITDRWHVRRAFLAKSKEDAAAKAEEGVRLLGLEVLSRATQQSKDGCHWRPCR